MAKRLCTITKSSFSGTMITASGTVHFANNPVTCTLDPITSEKREVAHSTPQAAQASVTGTQWFVVFTPIGSQTYSGDYELTATAANEGSSKVEVGP
jgi:hypothetical protein